MTSITLNKITLFREKSRGIFAEHKVLQRTIVETHLIPILLNHSNKYILKLEIYGTFCNGRKLNIINANILFKCCSACKIQGGFFFFKYLP